MIGERLLIREIAVLLLAGDALLGEDFYEAEAALKWARLLEESVDTHPMLADGRHEGDCMKTPHTCCRCMLEECEEKAREWARYEGVIA